MSYKKCLGICLVIWVCLYATTYAKMTDSDIKIIYSSWRYSREIDFENTKPKMIKGKIFIPLKAISEDFDYEVNYDRKSKQITIVDEIGINVVLTLGKKEVNIDGKKVTLKDSVKVYDGSTYIPLRFVAEAFGYQVNWDQKINTVTIHKSFIQSKHFKYDLEKQQLLQKNNEGKDIIIADNITIDSLDLLWIQESKTPNGHYIVRIHNCHGEPHINDDFFDYYIGKNQLIDSADSHFWKMRSETINIMGEKVILSNGRKVKIYNDKTQTIEKIVDVGNKIDGDISINEKGDLENYLIEAVGDHYMIVRGERRGLLTLVYTDTNEKVELYKHFLKPVDQEYVETNDIPTGDNLSFMKQEGNQLFFRNAFTLESTIPIVHIYVLK